MDPLYNGQVREVTRVFVSHTVEPLYNGQVTLSLIQWIPSIMDKLGKLQGSLSLIQWSQLYNARDGKGLFDFYTVEPLYNGQVREGTRVFVSHTVELYNGQVREGTRVFVSHTVELYNGQVREGTRVFVPYTVHWMDTYIYQDIPTECTFPGDTSCALTNHELQYRAKFPLYLS